MAFSVAARFGPKVGGKPMGGPHGPVPMPGMAHGPIPMPGPGAQQRPTGPPGGACGGHARPCGHAGPCGGQTGPHGPGIPLRPPHPHIHHQIHIQTHQQQHQLHVQKQFLINQGKGGLN